MKHKIGKFTLELSHDCQTIYGDIKCGEFMASLCHAENTGSLYNDDDTKRLPVPRSVLDKCWKFEQEFFERFQYSQGTLEQRYENYLIFSDDGNGNDRNTGKPLKSFDEWLNS